MTQLWPRIPLADATTLYAEAGEIRTDRKWLSHPAQTFGATGGSRAGEQQVGALLHELTSLATSFGFPTAASAHERVKFDRAAAFILLKHMEITWSEAANREVWSFLALVPLSALTAWRFGTNNRERWIASDLTRHTWARLWWQATVFSQAPNVLNELSESDLNQLLERRVIGGDMRLTVTLAGAVLNATSDGDKRRDVIRDVTGRVRRRLAFTDIESIDLAALSALCGALVSESVIAIARRPGA